MAASWSEAHSDGSRSCAMSGRSPMTTNSVMPMPKLPTASERSAHVAAPLERVEEVIRSCYLPPRHPVESIRNHSGRMPRHGRTRGGDTPSGNLVERVRLFERRPLVGERRLEPLHLG